ncbi:hypothetical protein FOA52_011013 [Chlamydomonas sp. UWO 241]|nr:hypothetical protein FOA52_011013 [Chlamydomonas sp. UWO 241]
MRSSTIVSRCISDPAVMQRVAGRRPLDARPVVAPAAARRYGHALCLGRTGASGVAPAWQQARTGLGHRSTAALASARSSSAPSASPTGLSAGADWALRPQALPLEAEPTQQQHGYAHARLDRPSFHVAPPGGGWMNDPNGPLFYLGRWHLFYQYLPSASEWDYGLMWGHAVSEDKITWTHLPPTLVPTPGGPDQDGVFSGCACIDEATGHPVILFTGVHLRSTLPPGPHPKQECDLSLSLFESQMVAWPADPDDPMLTHWIKDETPILPLPPPGMKLAAWRDPFIISKPSDPGSGGMYTMMIGSGVSDTGGMGLVYRSKHLKQGWEYHGKLALGDSRRSGTAWECPLLAELQPTGPAPQTSDPRRFIFSVSPDAPTNASLYFIGAYSHASCEFDLKTAVGPLPLDLGDILYAPNTVVDPEGRTLLVAWQQERRWTPTTTTTTTTTATHTTTTTTTTNAPHHHDYPTGCLSAPRVLTLGAPSDPSQSSEPRLVQTPLPELAALRHNGFAWGCGTGDDDGDVRGAPRVVAPGRPAPIVGVSGPFLDIELTLAPHVGGGSGGGGERPGIGDNARGGLAPPRRWGDITGGDGESSPAGGGDGGPGSDSGGLMSGLLLHSAHSSSSGVDGPVLVLYDWAARTLSVIFNAVNAVTLATDLNAPGVRTVGGRLQCPPLPGRPLSLRVLIDATLLEVFTGDGEVLSTRVHRGWHWQPQQTHQQQQLQQQAQQQPQQPPEWAVGSDAVHWQPPGWMAGPEAPGHSLGSCGIDVVSLGGDTKVLGLAAYEMWAAFQPAPAPAAVHAPAPAPVAVPVPAAAQVPTPAPASWKEANTGDFTPPGLILGDVVEGA